MIVAESWKSDSLRMRPAAFPAESQAQSALLLHQNPERFTLTRRQRTADRALRVAPGAVAAAPSSSGSPWHHHFGRDAAGRGHAASTAARIVDSGPTWPTAIARRAQRERTLRSAHPWDDGRRAQPSGSRAALENFSKARICPQKSGNFLARGARDASNAPRTAECRWFTIPENRRHML